jgi:hypothetical protein
MAAYHKIVSLGKLELSRIFLTIVSTMDQLSHQDADVTLTGHFTYDED